ncbi:hypothetical protein PR048_013180 [Dryococelus australis]|uniref:Integrase catalytic domain-containing protein n=1 Tax=Dryococelus australis TaxID=614101 RepID=A0ABQ9HRF9_9NEOP|nr:hypothetical protein PR048_013180 [Dryococelus australis]
MSGKEACTADYFVNSGFSNWTFRVKLVLDEKQLLETTEINVEDIAEDKEKKEFLKKDAKAKLVIMQCLPEEYTSEIKTLLQGVVIKTANGGEMIATRAGKFMGDYGSGTISFEALIVPGLKNNLRLGHLNRQGLQVLTLPFSEEKFPQCLEGKAEMLPFKKNEKSTQSIGELLHSDTSGPFKTVTKRSEAEENLINFIKMAKTQHGVKSKRIRLDNGSEFSSNSFKKFCADKAAERMNLTLMNKVRTKFEETDLPRTLWGEAVCASVYELNRSPTSALQNRTPASAYMLKLLRESKLEPHAKSMNMVRYSGGGYRIWDPLKDKFVSSRDVTFNETKVGVGNDTAWYQGINIEEVNEHFNQKDSAEEFIAFEVPDKEKNKRNKPNRTIKKPSHIQEYELYMAYCLCAGEPQDYKDAIKLGNGWEEAIDREKAIETKWIFRTKKDGLKDTRLVIKGFQEEPANNVYAPVTRLPTIRLLISIAVSRKWEIQQLDIPTAFLNGYVDDDIYIKTPGRVKNEPGKVLKLKRSQYGLRSAPRKWNVKFHNFMETHGMKRSASDFCLYIGENVWLIIWVDDMLVTGEKTQVENLIRLLKGEFKAKDMGILSEFLGTMIVNDGDEVKIYQSSFINKILSKFNIILCKGVNTPWYMISKLTLKNLAMKSSCFGN